MVKPASLRQDRNSNRPLDTTRAADSSRLQSRRGWLRSIGALALGGGAFGCGWTGPTTRPAASAPLSRTSKDAEDQQAAIDRIPFDLLTEGAQHRIHHVLSAPSLYRQMPITVVECDPDLYVFLVRHPEVVVNMWDLLGITKVSIDRTGEYAFDANDGAGTQCNIELIYGDRGVHVMYAEGHYEGPLLRHLIRGRCVLVLQSEYAHTDDDAVFATSKLDMFVRFDNVGAELIARSLHPLVGKTADHNFVESTRFIGQVSKAAQQKSEKLQKFSEKLTSVKPDVLEQFVILTEMAADRAAARGLVRRPIDILTE